MIFTFFISNCFPGKWIRLQKMSGLFPPTGLRRPPIKKLPFINPR